MSPLTSKERVAAYRQRKREKEQAERLSGSTAAENSNEIVDRARRILAAVTAGGEYLHAARAEVFARTIEAKLAEVADFARDRQPGSLVIPGQVTDCVLDVADNASVALAVAVLTRLDGHPLTRAERMDGLRAIRAVVDHLAVRKIVGATWEDFYAAQAGQPHVHENPDIEEQSQGVSFAICDEDCDRPAVKLAPGDSIDLTRTTTVPNEDSGCPITTYVRTVRTTIGDDGQLHENAG